MRYLTNAKQSKFIDTFTIQETGIPSLVLMERASLAVAEHVQNEAAALSANPGSVKICAVCGNGNNGGDGIATARILHCRGYQVTIVLAGQREKLSKDCEKQLQIAENLSIPIVKECHLSAYNIIIDALFGIGLVRNIEGHFAEWIEDMNTAAANGSRIVAVDIPSGISTDNGQVMGIAVHADLTVTFGYMKLGLVFYPGASYAGKIYCEDIGFDRRAEAAAGMNYITFTKDDTKLLPKRLPHSNKGTYGRALIIAGSRNMAGAAYFSACAAYRMGTGLVTVCTPESNRLIIQNLLPEAVLKTYDNETPDINILKEQIASHQVIVLGPGLGRSKTSEHIVETVLKTATCPLVVDADALNILSEHLDWFKKCQAPTIITPHLKELSRLTGYNTQYIKENSIQVCEDFSLQYGVICIAKDSRSVIADGSDLFYINLSGNNGMSTGGSGDVLTGIIAGLLAQGMLPIDAARLGVYLHGLAGDQAVFHTGTYAMTASDLLNALPELLKNLEDYNIPSK